MIRPFLWFDTQAEEAMNFYVKVFNESPYSKKNSRILSIARYEKGIETPGAEEMEGKVLTAEFELNGMKFLCLDGGPIFKFNESISLHVSTEDQEDTDYFWNALSHYPESEQCGWLKDKYGLTWQIIPKALGELMQDPDRQKVQRVANTMLKQKKIIIEELEKAASEE